MGYSPYVKSNDVAIDVVLASGVLVNPGDPIGWVSGTGWTLANGYAPYASGLPVKPRFFSLDQCYGDGVKTIKVVKSCYLIDEDAPFTEGGNVFLAHSATATTQAMLTQTASNEAGYKLGVAVSTRILALQIVGDEVEPSIAVAPHEVDTTQRFPLGTRVVTPDGRVYRYAYANGTCNTEVGAYKAKKTNTVAVAPTQGTDCGDAGDSKVTVTIDTEIGILTTGVLSKNELAGGYIVIGNGSAQHPQMRKIVSHAALATTGGSLDLTLDAPLTTAVTASTTTIELMECPYYCLKADNSGGDYVTFVGMPSCVAADTEFFWVQTWGPCWITSDGNTCDSARDRSIVFVGNGSVVSSNDVTMESGFQLAGVALDMSGSGASNAPMVMLQISP